MNYNKDDASYKTIGEVARKLNLIDKKTGQLQTHTIRYWETQFKQIKPKIKAGGRRYYTNDNIKRITLIKFLLKEKGLTINGAKKILNEKDIDSIDDTTNLGVYKSEIKSTKFIKDKVKNISKIIKELKKIKNG
tara:strand:+ start:1538 stop:1939 length:402 start_codon:yes stop_codon:yes gene_type:complete